MSVGDDLIAAGFGKTAERSSKPGVVLRMVLLRVSDSVRGWVMLASVGEGASGGGAGDSGGPVFSYRGMHSLVGIIVAVSPTRTKAVALSAHYDWIKETVAKLSGREICRHAPRRRGRSSTPRLLGSITDVSGILDHPPSRMMTARATPPPPLPA